MNTLRSLLRKDVSDKQKAATVRGGRSDLYPTQAQQIFCVSGTSRTTAVFRLGFRHTKEET